MTTVKKVVEDFDGTPEEKSLKLSGERTNMSMNRTSWSAERTLMGWIRTALSMISFGFTIGKLSEALEGASIKGILGLRTYSVSQIAYFLVVLGTLSILIATIQYNQRLKMLRELGLHQEVSLAFIVAAVLTLLGAFAFTALALKL